MDFLNQDLVALHDEEKSEERVKFMDRYFPTKVVLDLISYIQILATSHKKFI